MIMQELIKVGVVNLMVPGMLADGCLAITLSFFYTSSNNANDYDPATGCLTWLNNFAQNHNTLLQTALVGIRERHPDVFIAYADYYSASLQLYHSSETYGKYECTYVIYLFILICTTYYSKYKYNI